jgi:NAD(P)-dependent dehydrogenase (short-subunit alcohol dehydrogenase family)
MAALRSELQGLGHEHQPHLRGIVCDVTQPDQVAALAAQARQLLGTVDVWICNAGACFGGGVCQASLFVVLFMWLLLCVVHVAACVLGTDCAGF